MAKVTIVSGANKNLEYEIDQEAVLGRSDNNTIPLQDSKASRKNSRIFFQGGDYYIEDLKSRNGTIVNGREIDDKHLLSSGDRIKVGNTILLYLEDDDDPGATTDISKLMEQDIPDLPTPKKVANPKAAKKRGGTEKRVRKNVVTEKRIRKQVATKPKVEEVATKPNVEAVTKPKVAVKTKPKNSSNLNQPKFLQYLSINFSQFNPNHKLVVIIGIIIFMTILYFISRWLTLAFLS